MTTLRDSGRCIRYTKKKANCWKIKRENMRWWNK